MEVTTIQSGADTLLMQEDFTLLDLVSKRENKSLLSTLQEHYEGLLSIDVMRTLLDTQDYGAVLKCLYSEKNQQLRLGFLRNHAHEGHALLLFELALEELRASPTMETFVKKTQLYLQLGLFRLDQDLSCMESLEFESVKHKLAFDYQKTIDVYARAHLGDAYLAYMQEKESIMNDT